MKRLPPVFLSAFLLVFNSIGWSQQDTLQQLKEVTVIASRLDMTGVGKHTETIDSTALQFFQNDNLGTLFSRQTPLYIRSYGIGTLATLGIRGGNAGHTHVLWNGIPVGNPMLGQLDIALQPVSFFDNASIHYGGHGAAFGSGAVGGLISLDNADLHAQNAISGHLGIGSWGFRSAGISAQYGQHKFAARTRLLNVSAENDYRYEISEGGLEKRQSHHRHLTQGIVQEARFDINEKQSITGRAWYQYTNRQLPPTSVQTFSKAAQQDEVLRTMLQWEHTGEKIQWDIKAAWLDETIDYQDSLILLYTTNRFKTWITDAAMTVPIGLKLRLAAGLYAEHATASSPGYDLDQSRDRQAAYMSVRYRTGDLILRAQARQERTDRNFSPQLWDFAGEYEITSFITLKASASRNYRIPTLNDLNWRPGGNPNLLPEQGWTYEGGFNIHHAAPQWTVDFSATGYTRNIDQWIIWLPPIPNLRTYWAPMNVAEVNSYGMEGRFKTTYTRKNWSLEPFAAIDLTWSEFGESIPDLGIEQGRQMFYIPVENVNTGIQVNWKTMGLFYQHQWHGDSPGINEQVEAFNLGAAGIMLNLGKDNWNVNLNLRVDNIWDTPYRLIERRPMPGRSFQVGISSGWRQ